MTNDVLLYRLVKLSKECFELYNESGLCSIDPFGGKPTVQILSEDFRKMFNSNTGVELRHRGSSDCPWERSVMVDGVRFFCISDKGIGGMTNGAV